MSTVDEQVSGSLARGLAARLRDCAAAADRLASFSFDGPLADAPAARVLDAGDEPAVAHDFVLRVLRAAGDAVNDRLLTTVVDSPHGVAVDELTRALGLPRLAVLERVAELTQLGLLGRDLTTDSVLAGPAGVALVATVRDLSRDTATWLERRRRP